MTDQPETPPASPADRIAEIVRGLTVLTSPFSDQEAFEFRALHCSTDRYQRDHTRAGFYSRHSIQQAAEAIFKASTGRNQNGTPCSRGQYLTFNPLPSAWLAKDLGNRTDVARDDQLAKDQNITRRVWLYIDIDPVRPAGVSSTDEEKAHALTIVEAIETELFFLGWPSPVKADSGNGFHLFYRINLPADDGGIVKACLRALAAKFDTPYAKVDTSVFNPARIAKVPGSSARKGSNSKETGRPWRWSKLLSVPEGLEIVPDDLLKALAAEAPPEISPAATKPATQKKSRSRRGKSSNPNRRREASPVTRAAAYLQTIAPAISGQGGHQQTMHAALEMVHGFNLTPDEARPLLLSWNATCQPPWTEKEIEHKLQDADATPGERGLKLLQELPPPQLPAKRSAAPVPSLKQAAAAADAADGIAPDQSESVQDKTEELTELANGRKYADLYRGQVLYCPQWKQWLAWSGIRWATDSTGSEARLAKQIADMRMQAAEDFDDDELRDFANRSASARGLSNMVKVAQSEPGMYAAPAELDQSCILLNVPNGTIDLSTGKLRPHDRTDRITKLCPTPFDSAATCPSFEKFLTAIFDEDWATIQFMQRFLGYCLTGHVSEQMFLILYGTGSNGKSTLLNTLSHVLGMDYVLKAVPDLLLAKRNESHPTERADLFGKRLAICAETGDGRRFNEALVKELTGGDKIRARRLYEDHFEFTPTHKLLLCTNHKPRVTGTDHSIWRRIALAPLGQRFWNPDAGEEGPPELRQDKALPDTLKSEASGILKWMIDGCLKWQRDGLGISETIRCATEGYRADEDVIAQFIMDCCVQSPEIWTSAKELYLVYMKWAEEQGLRYFSQKRFGAALTERNFDRFISNGVKYRGIGLKIEVKGAF